jgi:hypothetical protein
VSLLSSSDITLIGWVCAADEANKLMRWREEDAGDLEDLLSFFVMITKEKQLAHVVLATSDYFLVSWLAGSECCRPLHRPSPVFLSSCF